MKYKIKNNWNSVRNPGKIKEVAVIKWEDAILFKEVKMKVRDAKKLQSARVISAGLILEEKKDRIILCQDLIYGRNEKILIGGYSICQGIAVIPKSFIKNILRIKL